MPDIMDFNSLER